MSNKTIVKNATKYFLAILITMYLWQFAGRMATEKNDISNIIGYIIYFAMSISWFLMIKRDITISVGKFNN
jgi:4-amino-4-deoxy-L-arabinose transferase-like glycosyltransferase